MKSSTAIIGGVLAIVIIGGLIYYISQNSGLPSGTATSTIPGGGTGTNPGPTAGVPVAATSKAVPSDTTVVLSGTVTPKGALTTYWYEYGTSQNLGSVTKTQAVGSGFVAIPAPGYITGLVKETTYYFRLVAENQYGKTMGTIMSFTTTVGTPAPVGSAPVIKTLAAAGISVSSANLNGEVTPNKASTQYWFEYGTTGNLGNVTSFSAVGDGSAKVPASAALANLSAGTTYYYRINAQNQFGTVNGAILTFKTSGAPVSASPVVTTQVAGPVATTTATLRATVNPSGAQTTYWFEYSTDSLLGSVLLKTTPQKSVGAGNGTVSVEANVTGLQAGTNYYYRIVAQNNSTTVRGDKQTFQTK